MHEIVILLVDFKATNFIPTSEGREEFGGTGK
jgi:hypothetical protein